MNKNLIKIFLSWILVFIWMIVIFNLSNMNNEESNTQSKDILDKVVDTTIDTSNKIGIITETISSNERKIITNNLNEPLRNSMHFIIFFILSIFVLNAINQHNIKYKYLITLIICFVYAITDEYHQTLVTGRTGEFIDVIIDLLGTLTLLTIYKLYKKYKK